MTHVASNIPGQVRMLQVVREGLRRAGEVDISVSFLRCSGLGLFTEDLVAFVAKGGKARILTSTYMGITQPEALCALLAIGGVEARVHIGTAALAQGPDPVHGFHPKFYIFTDSQTECWVGSSNITKGGLATNIEANIRQVGTEAVAELRKVFNALWNRNDVRPVTEQFASSYAEFLRSSYSLPVPPPSWTTPFPFRGEFPVETPRNDLPRNVDFTPNANKLRRDDLLHIRPNEAQREALQRLQRLRESGESRACVIAAPGIGKTFLAAFDAAQTGATSVLFLSHRLEHLTQALRTFQQVFGENRRFGRIFEGYAESNADFLFATVSSATANKNVVHRPFDFVIIDEFHHAEAPSYKHLLERLDYRFLLGLTATPERQDGHDVLQLCDFNVAYEVRLVEAINRGWLLPFHYFGITDDTVDYSSIPWRSGRFNITALEIALMLEARVEEISKHALQLGFDGPRRATIGFCAGVRHARFMAQAFVQRGLNATVITGEDSVETREAVYERLKDINDPLEWVFVADVLNEGVDIPCINSILFLRPTESATIFIQQLGRGLRLTPGCQVLTVLDFVGHHKSAWLALSVLHDSDASVSAASIVELDFTPPQNCEVVLDTKTFEILTKIKKHGVAKKDLCLNTYKELREETERPYPLDLWGRTAVPEYAVFKSAFGSWLNLRKAAEDAEEWETKLAVDDPAFRFLESLEKDWQAQRVYPYALVWALTVECNLPPADGYDRFFERFPRWKCEYRPLLETKGWQSLRKNLGNLLEGDAIAPDVLRKIPAHRLAGEVEGRIRLTLEKDFRSRHGGILRSPVDLVLHRRYGRPEIVNHFGSQYDPAKHNFGVLKLNHAVVIITKIDTSGAVQAYHYTNRFADAKTFLWQSQNQQRQDNPAGRVILDHKAEGRPIHLFVQSRSHTKAVYCGQLEVQTVHDNAPMNVRFALHDELGSTLLAELTSEKGGPSDCVVPLVEPVVADEHDQEDEFITHLPLYSLSAAAGYFGSGEAVEAIGWINASSLGKLDKGMFVVTATGRSMEPLINNGDLVVFRANPIGSRQNKIILAQYRDISAPDTGGSYTVKKYSSEKRRGKDSPWEHTKITLSPLNPDYEPIHINEEDGDDFKIIGEFVGVLPRPR